MIIKRLIDRSGVFYFTEPDASGSIHVHTFRKKYNCRDVRNYDGSRGDIGIFTHDPIVEAIKP
jgi:hypothetical protein